MPKAKPISLHPLKFDEILKAVVDVTASPKPVSKKQSKSKSSSKSAS